jgi:hypothetical protein
MTVCEGRADVASIHRARMAREILATRLDFGEPSEGAEIGDGVVRCRKFSFSLPRCQLGHATVAPIALAVPNNVPRGFRPLLIRPAW